MRGRERQHGSSNSASRFFLAVAAGCCLLVEGDDKNMTDGDKLVWGDAWGNFDVNKSAHHCRHGDYDNETKVCKCFDTWGTAHITDTIDFLEGVCEQYQCKDTATCVKELGIEEATCPVPGWNCYCGWRYAFYNEGHGYETQHKRGGGECMGLMYTFSVWSSELLWAFIVSAWRIFFYAFVAMLPIGRKRQHCDHHRPSLWNYMSRCFGFGPSLCHGECVLRAEYSMDRFWDDIAWSMYAAEMGLWFYLFLTLLYFIALFVWSVLLWLMVMVVIIASMFFFCCFACLSEGASLDCTECSCGCCSCESCPGGICCECAFGDAAGVGAAAAQGSPADLFYWQGPMPSDPCWGNTGYGSFGSVDCGDCHCCECCCRPLAGLLFLFPVAPENMWGGLLGHIMGTRTGTSPDRVYGGGNPVVEFLGMGWRRTGDLHHARAWRGQVYEFVVGPGAATAPPRLLPSRSIAERTRFSDMDLEERMQGQDRLRISNVATVIFVRRPFDLVRDRCFRSSFEDYSKNECWICTQGCDEWDLWMSCKHLFCRDCSTEMLKRRMPCPLCRVSSSTALRGISVDAPPHPLAARG